MEQVHLRVRVQALEEVQEWVDLVGEGWAAPEPVQALEENAFVLSVELLYLMTLESLAPTSSVQNVAQK
jgi:hypothetical protein